MRLLPLVLALAAGLTLSACKKPQEAAVAAATGGQVEMKQDGDQTTYKTKDGTLTISSEAGQSLPADFPSDAFLPSGYKINTSAQMGGARTLEMEVPGSMADVAKAVADGMQAQSWQQAMSMQQNDVHALMYQKDGRTVQYTISKASDDGGATHVVLNVYDKTP